MKSVINGTTTYFVGNYYEVTGSAVTKYYYAGTQRVALSVSGTMYYLLSDQLGSTTVTTSSNGSQVAELRYDAWGNIRYTSGTTPTAYTYTGQYSNVASFGLLYYNARWYDPTIAHFVQPDTDVPASQGPQGLDRYAYVNNNPVRFSDPTGHAIPVPTGPSWFSNIYVPVNYGWDIVAKPIAAVVSTFLPVHFESNGNNGGAIVGDNRAQAFEKGSTALGMAWSVVIPGAATGVGDDLPTLEIDSTKMPNIASNIADAQANGAPSILTRTENPDLIAANRTAATSGFAGLGSPDEYPFASTYEGGVGAYVRGVPIEEQRIQGGTLKTFYFNNHIMDGDRFRVRVVNRAY